MKTEHAGAKKGKGSWCKKFWAKKLSRRARRIEDKRAQEQKDY